MNWSVAEQSLGDLVNLKTLLTGPARTGKSSLLKWRLRELLLGGASGDQITVVTISRSAAKQTRQYLDSLDLPAGATPHFDTYFGIAGATVAQFWPLVRDLVGVSGRRLYPVPLANDLAQFHLRQVVEPLMRDRGYFRGLRIRPERIVAQLLDTAHNAALNEWSLAEAIERLKVTWVGQRIRLEHFDQAKATLEEYRQFCARYGLVDVSLLVEYFSHVLVTEATATASLSEQSRHLLVDNLEEHPPVAQRFLADLAEQSQDVLFVADEESGFRQFLGAYPAGVEKIAARLDRTVRRESDSSVAHRIAGNLLGHAEVRKTASQSDDNGFGVWLSRSRMEMIDLVVSRAVDIVKGPAGGEQRICLLAPYVDGVLALLIRDRLSTEGIPLQVRQPGEALIDRPGVRAFYAVAAMLHPRWERPVKHDDLRLAIMLFLDLDAVTASILLDRSGFRMKGSLGRILDDRTIAMISEESVAQYDYFQRWSATHQAGDELPVDLFVRKLFGELVARSYQPARTPPDLIADFSGLQQVARRFVEQGPEVFAGGPQAAGPRFLDMLSMRVTPARTDDGHCLEPGDVYLMPVHTFLAGEMTCDHQFWLDAGSQNWWEPPARPLANSNVLRPDWPIHRVWDARAKASAQTEALARVVLGLGARAQKRVTVFACEEGGSTGGVLWRAVTKTIVPRVVDSPVA